MAAGKPVILRLVLHIAIGKFGFSENFFPTRTGSAPALLFAGSCLPVAPPVPPRDMAASGDDRDRTGNLRLAKPALSQLSYVPRPRGKSQISNLKSQIPTGPG